MPARSATWSHLKVPGLLVLLVFLGVVIAVWSLNQQLLQGQREQAINEARQLALGQVRSIREDFQDFREEFIFSLTSLNYPQLLQGHESDPAIILPVRRFLALNQPLVRNLLIVSPAGQARELTFEKAGYFSISQPTWEEARARVRDSSNALRGSVLDLHGHLLCEVRAELNLPGFLQSHLQRFQASHPRHTIHALLRNQGELQIVGSRKEKDDFFSVATQQLLAEDLREQYEGKVSHRGVDTQSGPWIITVYAPLTLAERPILVLVSIDEQRIFSSLARSWRIIFWATVLFLGLLALVFWSFFRRILRDQREREKALESLEKSQQHLLQTQAELQASNRELQAAIEKAEEAARTAQRANEAKNDFLAVMSHEIRTPLNGLLGFTELLRSTHLSPEQQEFVHTVQNSGETLLLLLNDLLDFSKIESGAMELSTEPVVLRQLLDEVTKLQQSTARRKGIRLSLQVDPACPASILTDRQRLRQVLLNLLSNALKFTSTGEVETVVSPGEKENELHFSVRDTGCGIPPDMLETIFHPFTQVDASSSRQHGGTGLGLAICRRVVSLLGGRLWVESELNQGSCFHFSIPCPAVMALPSPLKEKQPAPKSAPAPAAPHLAHLKVLVAEDNPINQKLLLLHLKKLGITPVVVSDGLAAVKACEDASFHCILMDLQMPHLDGLEATRRIRQLEKLRGLNRTLIVAVTANVTEAASSQCSQAGMDEYLTKPLQSAALVAILEKLAATVAAAN